MLQRRINGRARRLVVETLLSILLTVALVSSAASAPRRTHKKVTHPKVKATAPAKPELAPEPDTTITETKPLKPIPPFAQLDRWDKRSLDSQITDLPAGNAARSILRLCRYDGVVFDVRSPLTASLSPLEWPAVFADQTPNPKRQRLEMENLLTQNNLRFQPLITVEPKDLADLMARAIADGEPVLLNTPGAAIVYGYDRRESDPWWLMQWRDHEEIVFESERMKSIVWWTDDPSANIAWAVAGPDSAAAASQSKVDDYAWLRTVIESVNGNEKEGLSPYPLSIRKFREELSSDSAMPEFLAPVDTTDPLGVRTARAARNYTVDLVGRLIAMTVDTALSQPLRLALYFYHNSTQSLDRLDSLLYDASPDKNLVPRAQENWLNPARNDQSLTALTQLLEWERQAAQQIATALQAHDAGKR